MTSRLQRCVECGAEGSAPAVLHLQEWFPCPVCEESTRREYVTTEAPPNPKPEPEGQLSFL